MLVNRSKIISISSTGIQFSKLKKMYINMHQSLLRWRRTLMASPKVYIVLLYFSFQVRRVVYPHTPQAHDELELIHGDFCYVEHNEIEESPDGWYKGASW